LRPRAGEFARRSLVYDALVAVVVVALVPVVVPPDPLVVPGPVVVAGAF
jgi:hypothetical protein